MKPSFTRGAIPRSCMWLLAGMIAATGTAHAQQTCRPDLTFQEVRFSAMQQPALTRKWRAVISVDASRCVAGSNGSFEIAFLRLKENGPDTEFRERFVWVPPSVTVEKDFWADEAVERAWFGDIAPCPCAR